MAKKIRFNEIKSALISNVTLQVIPIVAALYSVPYIVSFFGKSLFAIFALSVAYIVGLNYLHMGVATNVNRDLAGTDVENILVRSGIFWTGFVSMLIISLCISGSLSFAVTYYVGSLSGYLGISSAELEVFFRTIVYQTPLVMLLIFFRAVLESSLKFSITALNRAILNTSLLCTPLISVWLNLSFGSIPLIFLVFHIVSLFYLMFHCREYLLLPMPQFSAAAFTSMLRSGASLTLVSLAMLVFLYGDRYILSVNGDLGQIAYFLAPFDVLARISFVYGSIGAVFFPVFSQLYSNKLYGEFVSMFFTSYWLIFSIVGLAIFIVILFSGDLLDYWLGEDFKNNSVSIVNILALGIFFTGLSTVPSRALIALKKEAVLGYVYGISAIAYLAFSYFLIGRYSITGAAYAFLTRSILELLFLNIWLGYSSQRLVPNSKLTLKKAGLFTMAPLILLSAFSLVDASMAIRIIASLILMIFVVGITLRAMHSLRKKENDFG